MSSVLICALSGTGGARSFVSVATTLLDRGHEVTVLSGPESEQYFVDLPLRFFAVAEPVPSTARPTTPATSRAKRAKQAFAHVRTQYVEPMPQQWEAVQRLIGTARVDVVIVDVLFLGGMALTYLPRAQRPFVIGVGTVPPIIPDRAVPPYGLGVVPRDNAPGRLLIAAIEVANSRAYAGAGAAFQDAVEQFTGRRPHPDVRRVPMQQDVFAQLTVPRFEYPRTALPANFRFIGPLRPVEAQEVPSWWDPELEPPVVAVDVAEDGDLADLALPTVEAFGGAGVVVLIAGAERLAVETARGRPLPANVHFEREMPWSRLLVGRSVLVTAGDYLPVQYALRFGTPVVAAPDRSSRMETAARVEWSGAGINLRTGSPSAEVLRRAVQRAFADTGIQRSAARIAAQIAASDAEGSLADIVEAASGTHRARPAVPAATAELASSGVAPPAG